MYCSPSTAVADGAGDRHGLHRHFPELRAVVGAMNRDGAIDGALERADFPPSPAHRRFRCECEARATLPFGGTGSHAVSHE